MFSRAGYHLGCLCAGERLMCFSNVPFLEAFCNASAFIPACHGFYGVVVEVEGIPVIIVERRGTAAVSLRGGCA